MWRVVGGLFLAACLPSLVVATDKLPVVELSAGVHRVQAEVAATPAARQKGLMYREAMAQQSGMLFVFEQSDRHCFWMKNTLLPLSIAFLDDKGGIVNIADMQPQSEQSHCAAAPVRYALEMNQGWFAKRGLKSGARVAGLEKLPR
ncbi:DUF192 domain-containing protein [Uliginosibacterium sp. H1]|uniref:DUF192 domain-containing protein n=1 Tax=Uliginosibacterium sp. H1 TaxID=3114757 RepID=UPI002E16F4B2|nr:DUF192 domain-containing protein [Uliginosibacterium sp. H1]